MKSTTIRNWLSRVFSIAVLTAVGASIALAQIEVGGVTGTVRDQSGAVVNGAKVTLTNNDTKVSQEKITAAGVYAFPAVEPGTYTIRFESAGFETQETIGIVVHVQQVDNVDATLRPGQVTQQVVVADTTPLLQTENAEVGQTIDTTTVNAMPLNGRNWASLSQLSAGVDTGQPAAGYGSSSSPEFSALGQILWQNDFRLDGVDDAREFYNLSAEIVPPPDAIEEFKVQTGDYSAEFGHSTGPVINALIKSGTNHIRGDVWEYFRNDALDANDYFSDQSDKPKGELRQNQYGGTVGGPIYIPHIYDGHNRSFFFFDYQELRATTPYQVFTTVPTPLMQSSGFTNLQDLIAYRTGTNIDGLGRIFPTGTVLDPATTRAVAAGAVDPITGFQNNTGAPIYVRDPFYSGNVAGIKDYTGLTSGLNLIPAGRLDANAVKLLSLYPAATANNFSGNYLNNLKNSNLVRQYDIRIDHNFNENNMISGFWSWSNQDAFQPNNLPGVLDGGVYGSGTSLSPHWSASGSYTHVFSPTLTNEFRFGYSRQFDSILSAEANTLGIPAQFGIQGIPQSPGNGGLPYMSVSGISAMGAATYIPTIIHSHNMQIIDNVTKTQGRNLWKAGVDINSIEGDILQPPYPRGTFSFNGQFSDVPSHANGSTGPADFLLTPAASTVGGPDYVGGVTSISASSQTGTNDHRWYIGSYVEDSFKATPTLTFNLGLRYDIFTPYAETSGRQANLIPGGGGNGPGGTYYIPNKTCSTPRNPSFDALLNQDGIQVSCSSGLYTGSYQKANLAPRISFAKRFSPDFVVRGGFGIAYGELDGFGYAPNIGENYPFFYSLRYVAQTPQTPLLFPDGERGTLENGLAPINLADPALVPSEGLALNVRYPYAFKTPYSETYNLTSQYQVSRNDSIQIGYVGSVSRHLTNISYYNLPSELLPPGTAYVTPGGPSYIPFRDFAPQSLFHSTNAISAYNSAQFTYEHRLSYGLTLLGNYTFAKCLSDEAGGGGTYLTGDTAYRGEWLPGFGIRNDYGNCDATSTHTVHLSGTYRLPYGPNMRWHGNRTMNAVAGGWQTNWIYTHQSGNFFSGTCPVATSKGFGCLANITGNPYTGAKTAAHWLNAGAFANPPAVATIGQSDYSPLGSSRPNNLVGPGFDNLDSSIFKEFTLTESTHIQLRAEAFNTLNTPQFLDPTDLNFSGSTTFGKIFGLRNGPRVLQLAGKLYF